jgi:hypothetical protein
MDKYVCTQEIVSADRERLFKMVKREVVTTDLPTDENGCLLRKDHVTLLVEYGDKPGIG